ncbi:MAG: DUF6265 family protein [Sphingomicrobium sp.]
MYFRTIALMAAFSLNGTTPAAAKNPQNQLEWLVGNWRTEASGKWTVEHWDAARAGAMRGTSATGSGGKTGNQERMKIVFTGAKAAFVASANGAPDVTFVQASRTSKSIAFENSKHDYPQIIRYWRAGENLGAEISLRDGSKAVRWLYRPTRR